MDNSLIQPETLFRDAGIDAIVDKNAHVDIVRVASMWTHVNVLSVLRAGKIVRQRVSLSVFSRLTLHHYSFSDYLLAPAPLAADLLQLVAVRTPDE